MFSGLSAFPLTPLRNDAVDEASFAALIGRLAAAGVDSITALGSTGSYAYLDGGERSRVARLAVEHSGGIPVFVGIGALRTSQVLGNAENAEKAGASGLLLAPMTYQPLTENDVFELFRTVTEQSSLPVIMYDNPGTTHFTFTMDLYRRIAALPRIASVKIPGVPAAPEQARARVQEIRNALPAHVTIGVSGDARAAAGLAAGCDAWYSVIGGTLPALALQITKAASEGRMSGMMDASKRLEPLWKLYTEFGGSLRVVAAIAEHLNLVPRGCLPLPIRGLDPGQRNWIAEVVDALALRE